MSLMDILNGFRGGTNAAPANPTPPQNPNQPANPNLQVSPPPAVGNATVPGAGTNPAIPGTPSGVGAIPPVPEAGKSPLDNFAELFKVDPAAKGPTPLTPSMALDPAKLSELSKGLDFTQGMDPAKLALAGKGDTAALAELINSAGQLGFAHSARATAGLVERAIEQHSTALINEHLPRMIRENAVKTATKSDLTSNPAVAPVVDMLTTALQSKHPTATPEQIKAHVDTWMTGVAQAVVQQNGGMIAPIPAAASGANKNTDFSTWV